MPSSRTHEPDSQSQLDRTGQRDQLTAHRYGLGQMLHVGFRRDKMGHAGNRQEDREADTREIADEIHAPKANPMARRSAPGECGRLD